MINVETGGFIGVPFRAQIGSAYLGDVGGVLVSADVTDTGIRRWRVDLDSWVRDDLGGAHFQGRTSGSGPGLLVAQVTDGSS